MEDGKSLRSNLNNGDQHILIPVLSPAVQILFDLKRKEYHEKGKHLILQFLWFENYPSAFQFLLILSLHNTFLCR